MTTVAEAEVALANANNRLAKVSAEQPPNPYLIKWWQKQVVAAQAALEAAQAAAVPLAPIAAFASAPLHRVQEDTGVVTIDATGFFTGRIDSFAAIGQEGVTFADGKVKIDTAKLDRGVAKPVTLVARNAGGEARITLPLTVGPQTGLAIPIDKLVGLDAAGLDAIMQRIRGLGVTFVRFDFEWVSAFNNGNYNYDVKKVSTSVKAAVKAGLTPLVIWKGAGSWDKAKWEAHQRHVPHFSTAFANHFASIGCHHHELGNEPNLDSFMDNAVPVATMMAWHKATYDAIKAAQPKAVVISAGLSPVPTPSGAPRFARSALGFIDQMFAAGLKGKMDGLGFHPYAWENMPLSRNSWNGFQIMQHDVRNLMVAKGAGDVKIWSTEFGFPTGGTSPNKSGSEAQQLQTLIDGYDFLAATSWAGPVFWYNLDDYQVAGKTQNSEDYYGAFRKDGSRKPVAELLSSIKRGV